MTRVIIPRGITIRREIPMDEASPTLPAMPDYAAMRLLAMQAANVERVVLALENQLGRLFADGFPPLVAAWSDEQVPALRSVLRKLTRQCAAACAGTQLAAWVDGTLGIGKAVYVFAALLPPLAGFPSHRHLWKYVGLHVDENGIAPKMRAGLVAGFSPQLRARALMRLADPAVKQRRSPYRAVYDARRAHVLITHPEPAEAGGWTDAHRHRDALRVVAKAITRDLWRVAHGMQPIFSGVGESVVLAHRDGHQASGDLAAPDSLSHPAAAPWNVGGLAAVPPARGSGAGAPLDAHESGGSA